jgi:filamentous hemagglutinin family protein
MDKPSPSSWVTASCKWTFGVLFGFFGLLATEEARPNPKGGQVVAGSATITESGKRLDVNQASQKAIIDWRTFNIQIDERTHFNQPTNGSTLNRVNATYGASKILGHLSATGKIFIINSAGIVFGPNSYVDVAGIVATTMDIRNQDFLDGNYVFVQDPNHPDSSITNMGTIKVKDKGLAILVAPGVENAGIISAKLGYVVLGSGTQFTMDLHGDDLIHFAIGGEIKTAPRDANGNKMKDSIKNTGEIIADAGTVIVTARAASSVVENVINMQGHVQANTVHQVGGKIILGNGTGTVRIASKVKARGNESKQRGGKVTVLAKTVKIENEAEIDVSGQAGGGEILIGGNYQGKGEEPNAEFTFVEGDAILAANALDNGDGGRIIIWANERTEYFARLEGMGGPNGGDGGFAEVSGKDTMLYKGSADLSAPKGAGGTLLLDPSRVWIYNPDSPFGCGETTCYTYDHVFGNPGMTTVVSSDYLWLGTYFGPDSITIDKGHKKGGVRLEARYLIWLSGIKNIDMDSQDLILEAPNIHFKPFRPDYTDPGINVAQQLENYSGPITLNGGHINLTATTGINATQEVTINATKVTLGGIGDFNMNRRKLNINLGVAGSFTTSGSITNTDTGSLIEGSSGNDTFIINDNVSLDIGIKAVGGDDTITIGTNVSNSRPSIGGDGGTDTLIVGANIANTWTISGNNTGNLNDRFFFTDVESLTGGAGTDNFVLTGAFEVDGTIDGGAGDNTLLAGDNATNTWTINADDGGSVNTQAFSNIENLTGGTDNDTFTFNTGGSITGSIDGGVGGTNTLDYQIGTATGAISVNLTDQTATYVNSISNINKLVGSTASTTDALTGANGTNKWNITGGDSGDINGTGNFVYSSIEYLSGSAGNDTFSFQGGLVSGTINGGPSGTNTLDYSNTAIAITVNLQDSSAPQVFRDKANGFTNINNLVGSSSVSDTLIGNNQVNQWNIVGTNGGNINGSFTFSSIENLTGGSANDTFSDLSRGRYTGGIALTGTMNGGGGFNTYIGMISNVHSFRNIQLFISPEVSILLQDILGIRQNAEQTSAFFDIMNHQLRVWDLLTYISFDPLAEGDETRGLLPVNVIIVPPGQIPLNIGTSAP